LLTTYSFSRHIRRANMSGGLIESAQEFSQPRARRMRNLEPMIRLLVLRCKGGSLTPQQQKELQTFVNYIKLIFRVDRIANRYADAALFDFSTFPGTNDAAVYHTWQFIANLVDYLDSDDEPTVLNTIDAGLRTDLGFWPTESISSALSFWGNQRVYGLERHTVTTTVAVLCNGPVDSSPGTDPDPEGYDYSVSVEFHNPWLTALPTPALVRVHYTDAATNQITDADWPAGSVSLEPRHQGAASFTIRNLPGSFQARVNTPVQIVSSRNGIPVDVFTIPAPVLPTVPGEIKYVKRDTGIDESANDDRINWYKSLAHPSSIAADATNTMGAFNGNPNNLSPSAYVTTQARYEVTRGSDTFHRSEAFRDPSDLNNSLLWDSVTVASNTYYFARIRTLSDIVAAPYVGYVRDGDAYKGIGDWLTKNDDALRFDLTAVPGPPVGGIPDVPKGFLLRNAIMDRFNLLDRANDEEDQLNKDGDGNPSTGADDVDEMRMPGLINVNTAPDKVLQSLHYLLGSAGPAGKRAPAIVTERGNGPFTSIGDFLQRMGQGNYGADTNIKGPQDDRDIVEKIVFISRFANLISIRSDTFVAYVQIGAFQPGATEPQESRRWILLFDRSLCNQPPLVWYGTSDQWIDNPAYRSPKVVARNRVQ